jgi:protein ImuB
MDSETLREISCIFYPSGLEDRKLKALAEACLRFSPQVALRLGEAVFLETGGMRLIHEPQALALRLRRLAARYGPSPRLARGRHAAEALALARHGAARVGDLPMRAMMDYASPFQRDAQAEEWVQPMAGALMALGMHSLGSLLRLPGKTLGARFGADAALLRERVQGRLGMAWPRFEPEQVMHEAERFEPEDDFERLCLQLRRLTLRLGARLRGRGLRAARLQLQLGFERGARASLELRLSLPQSSPSAIYGLLREALDSKRRQGGLWQAVSGLDLGAPELAPGSGAQESLFDSRQREMEQWSSLVLRLRQRLGEDQVFLAELVQRYLPERAWKKMLGEARAPGGPAPAQPRPSRLLPEPKKLFQESGHFVQMPEKRRWHASSWEGPERINGEWWADGFDRDYFRVATEEGPELWIYSQAGAPEGGGGYWLHGYFD